MTVYGHHTIQTFFEQARSVNKLSHAYCFSGPDAVGKKTFAISLASLLLESDKAHTHPDCLFIEQELNKKTGKTKKHIDVDQIHQITTFFSRFAAMGGYRIAIIDGAEKMNENASNALLKTLEELPEKSIIFLVTTNKTLLLPTIRSRCQVFDFEQLPANDMKNAATALGCTDEAMIRHAKGKPGVLASWVADPESYTAYEAAVTAYLALYNTALYKKLAVVEPLFGDKKDHIATREILIKTLDIWIATTRDIYHAGAGNKALQVHDHVTTLRLSKENMVDLVTKMAIAKKRLRQNIHPRLLIEDILLSIP